MKKNKFLLAFKSIKVILLLFAVILVGASTTIFESKVNNRNENKTVNLSTMAMKIIETETNSLYSAKNTLTGDLTGYVYNCPLCGGTLGCKPSYNIKDGTYTYPDSQYGTVNIVASSSNLKCGSVIRFKNSRISDEPVFAIVLDRGVRGNNIDFLSPNYEYATKNIGRTSVTYDVLREGWGN